MSEVATRPGRLVSKEKEAPRKQMECFPSQSPAVFGIGDFTLLIAGHVQQGLGQESWEALFSFHYGCLNTSPKFSKMGVN